MATDDQPRWLGRDGWFRTVESFSAVTDLLADPRMHADLVGAIEGLGLGPGPAREHMAMSLLSLNGPIHRAHRSVVAPWFTPRAVERVRTTATRSAQHLAETLVTAGGGDVVRGFAVPYVSEVTASFLGIPDENPSHYLDLVRLLNSRDEDVTRRLDDFTRGLDGLVELSRRLLDEQARRGEGMIAELADAVATDRIPDAVAVMFLVGVFSAGNDPAINQLGLAVEVLSRHGTAWDALGTGAADVAQAVEEVLRYRPTNQQITRRVDEAFRYDGVDFRDGEVLVLRLASANHDPCRFSAPDRFAPDANGGGHVAFGFGAHYCLGAALARLQLQEALRVLTSTMTCPHVVDVDWKPEGGIVGADRLVVSVQRRPGDDSLR